MPSFPIELKDYAYRTKIKLAIIIVLASCIHLLLKIIPLKYFITFFERFFSKNEHPKPGKILRNYSRLMATCYSIRLRFYNCLSLSLVFWVLLRRKGVHVNIKFGTVKENDTMRFHAWLEHKGSTLAADPDVIKYIPFDKAIA